MIRPDLQCERDANRQLAAPVSGNAVRIRRVAIPATRHPLLCGTFCEGGIGRIEALKSATPDNPAIPILNPQSSTLN
jgi:hypothetical protein